MEGPPGKTVRRDEEDGGTSRHPTLLFIVTAALRIFVNVNTCKFVPVTTIKTRKDPGFPLPFWGPSPPTHPSSGNPGLLLSLQLCLCFPKLCVNGFRHWAPSSLTLASSAPCFLQTFRLWGPSTEPPGPGVGCTASVSTHLVRGFWAVSRLGYHKCSCGERVCTRLSLACTLVVWHRCPELGGCAVSFFLSF